MAVSLHNQKMRLEQLKRYEGSLLDKTSTAPRDPDKTKFRFKEEYIFLTVCASDDVKEAERLLDEGVDINTANVDGLTALHQACLNQRMDIVKLLVEHSADVNIRDNDGWTPLHAACSTNNIEIAGYLINNGSDLAAVSFEGELPIDVTEDETVVHFLSDAMAKHGIDSETAKSQEEKTIMEDAEHWLKTGTYDDRNVHPISGASPLHVAAARGYVDAIRILLKAGANINAQDCDGWTPMHAAAHWGQGEACQLLVNNLCDLSIPNSSGLLAQDVADPELGNLIEELKEKQVKMYTDLDLRRGSLNSRRSRGSVSRMSFDQKQMMGQKSRGEERTVMEMMLAKRNSQSDLEEDDSSVFDDDDDEDREKEMVVGVKGDAEKDETIQNCMNIEHVESENSTGIEVKLLKEKSIPCDEDEEENVGKSIQRINDEGSMKPEEKRIETENLSTESLAKMSPHQNQLSTNETASREMDDKDRSSVVSSETMEHEVSFDATSQPVTSASGSFLSSATTAALRALANSHMWSIDDPKKDEEKENARRSRAIQLRKEKLEKRRSTQGVSKEDVSRAGASMQATKGITEGEFQMSDEVDNKKDITLTLYRRNAPQEATIPFEDDEAAEATTLARARRKGRLSTRPVRQENFEEMTPNKENQGISVDDVTETKSNEGSEAAKDVQLDRLSSDENISVNSSLPLSIPQLPILATDTCHDSCLENDSIDYKKLYEKEQSLNEALLMQNKCLQKQINDATLQMEHYQEVCRSATKEKEELEVRISKLEAEFQDVEELKSNNQRLKLDNAALVRVIGHLSKQTTP